MPFFQVKYQASLKFRARSVVVFQLDWHGAPERSPCVNVRADFPASNVLFLFFSITLSLCGGKSLTCLNCGSHRVGLVVLMGIYGTQNKTQTAWIVYGCVYCSPICISKKWKCQSIRWAREERILSSPSAVWDGRDPVALWLEERYVRLSIFRVARSPSIVFWPQLMQFLTWPTKALTMHFAFYTSSVAVEFQKRVEWGLLGNGDPLKWKKGTQNEVIPMIYLIKSFYVGHTRHKAYCTFAPLSNSCWMPRGNLLTDSSFDSLVNRMCFYKMKVFHLTPEK